MGLNRLPFIHPFTVPQLAVIHIMQFRYCNFNRQPHNDSGCRGRVEARNDSQINAINFGLYCLAQSPFFSASHSHNLKSFSQCIFVGCGIRMNGCHSPRERYPNRSDFIIILMSFSRCTMNMFPSFIQFDSVRGSRSIVHPNVRMSWQFHFIYERPSTDYDNMIFTTNEQHELNWCKMKSFTIDRIAVFWAPKIFAGNGYLQLVSFDDNPLIRPTQWWWSMRWKFCDAKETDRFSRFRRWAEYKLTKSMSSIIWPICVTVISISFSLCFYPFFQLTHSFVGDDETIKMLKEMQRHELKIKCAINWY